MADGFAYKNIITVNYKIIKIRTKSNTPELSRGNHPGFCHHEIRNMSKSPLLKKG